MPSSPHRAFLVCIAIWAAAFAYAVVRYVVLGPVPASSIPLFVLNKSLSFAAVTLFAASTVAPSSFARLFGVVATWSVFAHVLASVVLLAAGQFDGFTTADGALSLRVQAALLVGIVGLLALVWQRGRTPDRAVRFARRGVMAAALVHVTLLGAPGWARPDTWHGGLLPITLLSAAVAAFGIAASLRGRRSKARAAHAA